MANLNQKIVIAGAGLAGLSAGVYLKNLGYTNILFIEATDRAGGKLKSDYIEGYTLNRGVNILNNKHNYLNELIDLGEVNCKPMDSGALVIKDDKLFKFTKPFKKNLFVPQILISNLGSFKDKVRFIKKRIELSQTSNEEIFDKFELKTSSYLKKKGFSKKIIKDFFRPYFTAFLMDEELTSSRRIFDYVFKTHFEGSNCILNNGTESLVQILTNRFAPESFMFNTKVTDFKDHIITLSNGEKMETDIFIIATEKSNLYEKSKNDVRKGEARSTTSLYFSASKKPFSEAMICVNANDPKLISNVLVLTNFSSKYAPKGKELICVTLNGYAKPGDDELEKEVKEELKRVFGNEVDQWHLLKIYRNEDSIPNQDSVFGRRRILELKPEEGLYLCGEHLLYGSLNAAVKSGKMIAEIINRDHNKDYQAEKRQKYTDLFS